jgi:hypothetical protein
MGPDRSRQAPETRFENDCLSSHRSVLLGSALGACIYCLSRSDCYRTVLIENLGIMAIFRQFRTRPHGCQDPGRQWGQSIVGAAINTRCLETSLTCSRRRRESPCIRADSLRSQASSFGVSAFRKEPRVAAHGSCSSAVTPSRLCAESGEKPQGSKIQLRLCLASQSMQLKDCKLSEWKRKTSFAGVMRLNWSHSLLWIGATT